MPFISQISPTSANSLKQRVANIQHSITNTALLVVQQAKMPKLKAQNYFTAVAADIKSTQDFRFYSILCRDNFCKSMKFLNMFESSALAPCHRNVCVKISDFSITICTCTLHLYESYSVWQGTIFTLFCLSVKRS